MEIQNIYEDWDGEERYYSVLLDEEEIGLFSDAKGYLEKADGYYKKALGKAKRLAAKTRNVGRKTAAWMKANPGKAAGIGAASAAALGGGLYLLGSGDGD